MIGHCVDSGKPAFLRMRSDRFPRRNGEPSWVALKGYLILGVLRSGLCHRGRRAAWIGTLTMGIQFQKLRPDKLQVSFSSLSLYIYRYMYLYPHEYRLAIVCNGCVHCACSYLKLHCIVHYSLCADSTESCYVRYNMTKCYAIKQHDTFFENTGRWSHQIRKFCVDSNSLYSSMIIMYYAVFGS